MLDKVKLSISNGLN